MDIWTLFILFCAFCSATLLVYSLTAILHHHVTQLLQRKEKLFEETLQDLFIHEINARMAIFYTSAGGVIIALLVGNLTGSVILGLLSAAAVTFTLPGVLFSYLKESRLQKLEEQLPAALDQMVSSAKSGSNLVQAIEDVADNLPTPVSQEFRLIVHNYKLGSNITSALEKARKRINRPIFNLVVTVLLVNEDLGGKLPKALESMSTSFIEIWRLEQKLITASAEGKKAVKTIAVMPFIIYLMVASLQPEMVASLTASLAGYMVLGTAITLYVVAIYWLRRTLRIEV